MSLAFSPLRPRWGLAAAAVLALMAQWAAAGPVQIQVLDKEGKPVSDAVVVLYPTQTTSAPPQLIAPNPVIEQEKMRFLPNVTVVTPGTTVRFTNQDRWDHHVRGTPVVPGALPGVGAAPAGFELRLAGKVEGNPVSSAEVKLDQPGAVLLGCHLHSSMRGHVFVSDSAWALKTDAQGMALFASVPEGKAQARVWHPEQLVEQPRKNLQVQSTAVQDTMQLGVVLRQRRPAPAPASGDMHGSGYY